MTISAGTKLGPYEIASPIGAGGMGEVYRARDPRLGREVAIKVLPAHLTKSVEFRARFEREAKSISQLTHPHVCTLYDVGHHDGADYLVMELLDGESLAQRLLKGQLPLEQVLKSGGEIASALDAAHRKGVIHRDLKPGNIMLTRGGAKLLDFGLAKSGSVIESDSNAMTVTQPLTTKGTILGTFQYMAPEQLEGQEADTRTDIFAFGAVLYEMATGKRAFEGASRASLIVSIMSSQPRPISEIQPLTPPALDRLIRKCLAKDPDARWQSAADVADELRWITEGGSQLGAFATGPSRRKTSVVSRGVLSALVLAMAGFAVAWALKPSVAEPVTYLSMIPPPGDIADGGLEKQYVALSPNGRTVAYTARRKGMYQLFVRDLGQREAVALTGTDGANTPFFSPDGKWIGYFTAASLKKVPVGGGVSMTLCETGDNRGAVWVNPDTIIVSPSFATPLQRLSAGGGALTPISQLNPDRKERTHRWPDALPGGEWVVFTVGVNDSPGGYDDCDIDAVSMKTGQRKTVIKGGSMARFAASGHVLFGRHGNVFAVPIDPTTAELLGPPVAVLSGVAGEPTSGAVHISISERGDLVYVSEGAGGVLNDELVFVGRDGKTELLPAPPAQFQLPQLSPDGKQILVSIGPGTGKGDVWRYDLERNLLTRLTFLDIVSQVLWTPDGGSMLYTTDGVPGRSFLQALDGRSPPRLVLTSDTNPNVSGFSPDGKGIVFSEYGAKESNISIISMEGGSQPSVVVDEPGPQYGARISPDGKWVVYASDVRGGEPEVFVRRFDGGAAKWQVSTRGGLAPLWSYDGQEIFFLQDESVMSARVLADGETLSFAAPQKLFDMPPGRRYERSVTPYDVSADGTKFLFACQTRTAANDRRINVVLNWAEELKVKVPRGK